MYNETNESRNKGSFDVNKSMDEKPNLYRNVINFNKNIFNVYPHIILNVTKNTQFFDDHINITFS